MDTPSTSIGPGLGAFVAFFVLAVVWACLGTIDIVASAPGNGSPAPAISFNCPVST